MRHPGESFKLQQMRGHPILNRYCTECTKPLVARWTHTICRKCIKGLYNKA